MSGLWSKFTSALSPESTDLGRVLLKMGCLNQEQLTAVLQDVQPGVKLGEKLVAVGLISRAELEEALEKQRLMRSGRAAEVMADIVERRAHAARPQLEALLKA